MYAVSSMTTTFFPDKTRKEGGSHVAVYTTIISDQIVHLIDTPGFDDSERSDAETLQELACWLTAAHERSIRLSGIIYLHRITDIRLQGSSWRALRALKGMCGDNNMHDVVIATTMWDKVPPDQVVGAFARQEELRKKINQHMGHHGGSIAALPVISKDATKIIEQIARKGSRMTLAFQKQLVDERKPICETDAGKILYDVFKERNSDLKMTTGTTEYKVPDRVTTAKTEIVRCSRLIASDMLAKSELVHQELMRFEQRLPDIRSKWEERIKRQRTALEEELRCNRDEFESKYWALADIRRPGTGPSNSRITRRDQSSLAPEPKERLPRKADLARLRDASHEQVSAGLGIVGTGLAVGQLVAAMACTVM
jgi:hypothetical protein